MDGRGRLGAFAAALRSRSRPQTPSVRDRRSASGKDFYRTLAPILAVQIAAILTHIYVAGARSDWGFVVLGVILYPVGVVHGIGCWFGWWS